MENRRTFKLIYCLGSDEPISLNDPGIADVNKVLDSFDFAEWHYLILEPSSPIAGSVFLQACTCDRKDESGKAVAMYDVEIRFEEQGVFTQYAYTTASAAFLKALFKNYLNCQVVFDLREWRDITEEVKNSADVSKPPIMEYIKDHIQEDGLLPKNFSIKKIYEKQQEQEKFYFVDGFSDGMILYHSSQNQQDMEPLYAIIQLISDGQFEEAAEGLTQYFYDMREVNALSIVDEVQRWIIANAKALQFNELLSFSVQTLSISTNVESIKFSLALLELFDTSRLAKCVKSIRTLALCNEFTLFCIYASRSWPKQNDFVFEIARKVFGWGKIFAVAHLEPQTEGIKEWLLEEGCHNEIVGAYSALEVARKIDLAALVQKNDLTPAQYKSIGKLLDLLLLEEPVAGISELAGNESILENCLLQASKQDQNRENYGRVKNILNYVQSLEPTPGQAQLEQLCHILLGDRQAKLLLQ